MLVMSLAIGAVAGELVDIDVEKAANKAADDAKKAADNLAK